MKPDLEQDFTTQQSLLLALLDERRSLSEGSRAAVEIDRRIFEVESCVRSYQMIKWYEQQSCGERKAHKTRR